MEWARSLGGPWRAEGASSAVIQSCLTLCDPMDCNMPSFPIHNQLLELAQRRRQWHPTPVLLPGKSHGQRSLVSCSPWGRWRSDMTEWLHFHALEKEMATHCSVLAWRIPGTGEPGGLLSMGSHRVRHDWSDLAAAAAELAQTRVHWVGDAIHLILVIPFSSCLQSFPASGFFFFFSQWVCSSHKVAKVLEFQL